MRIVAEIAILYPTVKPTIRKYRDRDREEIRKIAASTVTGYPRSDLKLVADLLISYYVNCEPEHLLVAEVEDGVVGYLSGCFNSTRCRWIKGIRIIPGAVVRALVRGEVGWREVRYLGSFIYVAAHGGLRSSPPPGYPAHFHINVAKNWRGRGLGTKLVESFFEMLRKNEISGVHVRVRKNDRRASRFFRSLGFTRENGYPVLVAEGNKFRTSRSIIYTKELSGSKFSES